MNEDTLIPCWYKYYQKYPDGTITEHAFDMPFSADMILTFLESQASHMSCMTFVKEAEHVMLKESDQIALITKSFETLPIL